MVSGPSNPAATWGKVMQNGTQSCFCALPQVRWINLALLIVVLCCPGLSGCGSKVVDPVTVQGKCEHEKEAVAGVLIRFWPETDSGSSVEAFSAQDGSFRLECVPGVYKVSLLNAPARGKDPSLAKDGPAAVKTTPKEETEPSSEPSMEIPERYRSPITTPLKFEIPETGKDNLVIKIP
jgi:hypothetical protein